MTFDEYRQIDAANWSTLKELRRSARHYKHALTAKRDSKAMRLGRASHVAVLEPERFASQYAIWDQGRRFGKKWDAYCAEHASKEILAEQEFSACMSLQSAVRANPLAARHLMRGEAEVTMVWADEQTGLALKGRADWIGGVLLDLKTTRDASPDGFAKEVVRYGYHCQLSLYQDGWAEMHGGERLPVAIVAVESLAPHVVTVFRVPDHVLETGRAEVRELLSKLVELRKAGEWPGYSTEEVQLELPAWAERSTDDDVGGLGLEFDTDSEVAQ